MATRNTSKRKSPKRKRPLVPYRDKPKRTTSEARQLITGLLANADDEPEGIEVARDLAFEHEIDDMMMLFDIATDLKLSPVDIGNAEWNGDSLWDEDTVNFTLGGIEYRAVKDDDTAERIALRSVTQDLQNEPEMFNQDWLQSHIDMAKLREMIFDGEMEDDYVDELARRQTEDFWRLAGLFRVYEPEADEDGNVREPTHAEIDEVKRAHAKDVAADPMDRLRDIYGDEAPARAIEMAGIDIDGAAKEAVASDGWQHFLSTYDGDSHTTKHGYVYWREN